jgi:ubiquitin-protein ligase
MNVQRIQWEIRQAVEHFPNIESHAATDGGIYIKALLQTSVGQVYVIAVTFVGYPSEMPKVTVITPAVTHSKHMYSAGNICYMHPSVWNPAKHDLKFVLFQTAVWLNKHEIYIRKGVWPGPGLSHAT